MTAGQTPSQHTADQNCAVCSQMVRRVRDLEKEHFLLVEELRQTSGHLQALSSALDSIDSQLEDVNYAVPAFATTINDIVEAVEVLQDRLYLVDGGGPTDLYAAAGTTPLIKRFESTENTLVEVGDGLRQIREHLSSTFGDIDALTAALDVSRDNQGDDVTSLLNTNTALAFVAELLRNRRTRVIKDLRESHGAQEPT